MVRRTVAFFVCMILCWISVPSQAAEISCHKFYEGVSELGGTMGQIGFDKEGTRKNWPSERMPTTVTCLSGFLSGQIVKGDYDKVAAFLRAHHPFLVSFTLNSPGGDADEAMRIGRLFRKYLITTFNGDTCASACALIWFGGVERLGTVGVHRPQINDPMFRGLSPAEASTAYRRALAMIAAYLDEMEVPKSIIELMVATSSNDIRWVDSLYNIELYRPPSIAEWADASCGSSADFLCEVLLLNSRRDRLAPP